MEWDIRNDQPIYTQLIQQVTLAILSGTFPCGGRLPPVREMAAEAGVNPNTMQRALTELERDGLVYSQRPSLVMPTVSTSYLLRSMLRTKLPTETQLTSCSLDIPPNNRATHILFADCMISHSYL